MSDSTFPRFNYQEITTRLGNGSLKYLDQFPSFLSTTMSSSGIPRASGSRSQSDPRSQPTNGTRKKGRYANIEEMFAGSTPEEVEQQTAQYRNLLNEAEGTSLISDMKEADNIETKGDLANRTFKDIRTAVKSGEALFRTSMSIEGEIGIG